MGTETYIVHRTSSYIVYPKQVAPYTRTSRLGHPSEQFEKSSIYSGILLLSHTHPITLTLVSRFVLYPTFTMKLLAFAALASLAHIASAVGVVGKAEGFASGVTGGSSDH